MSKHNKRKLHVYILTKEYTEGNDPNNDRYRIVAVYSDRASAEHRLHKLSPDETGEYRIIEQTVKGQIDFADILNQLSV